MFKKIENIPYCAPWPGAMINTNPVSNIFYGSKGVRAIEVLLYLE